MYDKNFSPSDGAMFLWHEKEDKNTEGNMFEEDAEQNKEHWVAYKMLRSENITLTHF